MDKRKRIFLVAGEHSGDSLGAALMAALNQGLEPAPLYEGVGGELMEEEGLHSLFPLKDVAVMGLGAIISRLPTLTKRVYQTVDAAVTFSPDIVVIIDSPEFTHPIAKRIRKKIPEVPIIDYVSPSVWAWRPGRAKKMSAYVDHVLALLPFEPDAHKRLGGPACTYVGHSLVEKKQVIDACSPTDLQAELSISSDVKKIVVLPGSRPNEVKRLMEPFGKAIGILREQHADLEILIPVMPSVEALVIEQMGDWPVQPHLLRGEEQKFAAFNLADAALAASGTVTLELGLTKVPMVVAYRMGTTEYSLRRLVTVHSIVLANLVLGENIFPEFLQENCTPENLATALQDLLSDTPALRAQKEGLELVEKKIMLEDSTPSLEAAKIVQSYLKD
jgi:lipid-A-disaccharide synthase